MITPSTVPATNAIQQPRVRGVRPPKLGVTGPKMPRYRAAATGGFSIPKVSLGPKA